ncbi:MAG: hypothetical protein U0797_01215 [Gemmataceae bacterium]
MPRLLNQAGHLSLRLAAENAVTEVEVEVALEALALLGLGAEAGGAGGEDEGIGWEAMRPPTRRAGCLWPRDVRPEETRRCKIRETFRLIADEVAVAAPPEFAEPDLPAPEPVEEERSFIEIGPRRQIEASPDVLACPAPKRAVAPVARGVAFRNLPGAAGLARRSRFAAELVAFHAPDQPAASQYGALLEAILESARGRGAGRENVYLFSGTRRGSGTTTVLLNLAITAARQEAGHRRRCGPSPGRRRRRRTGAHPRLTDVLNGDAGAGRGGLADGAGEPERVGLRHADRPVGRHR